MRIKTKIFQLSAILFSMMLFGCGMVVEKDVSTKPVLGLPIWQEGYLDIHHINTGSGDATFFIMPDGTTMLFDVGDMDITGFNTKWTPLKATLPHPSDSLRAGQWIVNYIRQVVPDDRNLQIDYALISHFHSDHYGYVGSTTKTAVNGRYKLTGITDVGSFIPIKCIIDRDAPAYNYPVDLKDYYKENKTFQNYLKFVDYQSSNNNLSIEGLRSGASNQIKLKISPDEYQTFLIRNVKSNGTIWTGQGDATIEYLQKDSVVNGKGKFNENPLSLAIKISYGQFDYFTGGDMTGLQGYGKPSWFDVETPVAKAVGKVEVTTLNHHGNRDATNENFVKELSPRIVIQQSWCSDHPGQEVYERLISESLYTGERDIFATNIHEETKVTLGPWFTKAYQSMEGHIMIRVMLQGEEYYVYVLDDTQTEISIKEKFGPYYSE